MKKNMNKTKHFLSGVAIILLLVGLCVLLAAALVYPLWKWADTFPAIYTWFCLGLLLALAVYGIVKLCIRKGTARVLLRLARIAVIAAGLILCVEFVLMGRTIIGMASILSAILIYVVIRLVSKKKNFL